MTPKKEINEERYKKDINEGEVTVESTNKGKQQEIYKKSDGGIEGRRKGDTKKELY